jgi:dihydrodipicolinate synthase/N-acetylneuraminate lyase
MVNGETGDPFQLAHSERKQLLEWVIRDSDGLPVWAHISATTTSGVVDLCQHASRHGAKGAVVCPPPVGRYFEHEAKAMLMAINRHGNLQTLFADPEGKWAAYESPIAKAESVEATWALFESPGPDEMKAGSSVVTPFAMFGANNVETIAKKLEVFRPAVQSVIKHGGLNRAARAAMAEMGCDVGNSRSPVFELSDEGRKILDGILKVLSA